MNMKIILWAPMAMCFAVAAQAESYNLVCKADSTRSNPIIITVKGSDETGVDVVLSRNGKALQKLLGSSFNAPGEIGVRPINLKLFGYDENDIDRELHEIGFLRTALVAGVQTGFLVIKKSEIPITCDLP